MLAFASAAQLPHLLHRRQHAVYFQCCILVQKNCGAADLPQPIRLLVGTMTGTAELVAQEVEETLRRLGFVPTVLAMDHLQPDVFDDGGIFLIVRSTYGNGDVPDNAQAVFASLQQAEPDLSGVIYGVIALGDMTYKATFCN